MANPEPANEPSMEEILASIRRIISDDDDAGEGAPAAEAAVENDAAADEGGEVDTVANEVDEDANAEPAANDDNDQSSIDDIFELTEVAEDSDTEHEGEDGDEGEASDPVGDIDFDSIAVDEEAEADLDFVDAEGSSDIVEEPAADAVFETAEANDTVDPASLLSPQAQATASAAFGALASTMLSHSGGARTLEEIVEDLLRPLLKSWLDQNLPTLVEQLVREEIERVARRGT